MTMSSSRSCYRPTIACGAAATVWSRHRCGGELCENGWIARGVSLRDLKEKIDRTGKPGSMPLPGALARLQVTLKENHERAENVVGILPGADPNLKDQRV